MNIALKRPAPASKEAVLFLYELYQEAKKNTKLFFKRKYAK